MAAEDRATVLAGLERIAIMRDETVSPPAMLRDPDDDYLPALGREASAEAIVAWKAALRRYVLTAEPISSAPMRDRLPSPAMVVALLALAVALGGTTYAAVKLKRNTVTTKSIKAKAVTEPKLGNEAVSARTIGDGAVEAGKISDQTLLIRGWARVRGSDGALLGGRNVTVTRASTGSYCFDTNFAPVAMQVTLDVTSGASLNDHAVATLPATGNCSAPFLDGRVRTVDDAVSSVDRGFFVYFN